MAQDDRIVARSGSSTVEIDNTEVMRHIDRLTRGAVTTFLRAAHRQMDPIVGEARTDRMLWPRRTGASQDATTIVDRLRSDVIETTALNRVPYTYKLRFSVVTSAAIDREARTLAARTWGVLGPYVDRVNPADITRRGPYAGKRGARRRVASHFIEQASGGLWTKWWPKEEPSQEAMRRAHKASLISRHGTGAPSEQLAGKHVWSTRVRNPVRRREMAVFEEAREALDRLAEG